MNILKKMVIGGMALISIGTVNVGAQENFSIGNMEDAHIVKDLSMGAKDYYEMFERELKDDFNVELIMFEEYPRDRIFSFQMVDPVIMAMVKKSYGKDNQVFKVWENVLDDFLSISELMAVELGDHYFIGIMDTEEPGDLLLLINDGEILFDSMLSKIEG